MSELVNGKVRDIKDKSGRWEIRLEQRVLPLSFKKLAGNSIMLIVNTNTYVAHTGIAAENKPSQYFWINTHKNEVGPIKSILKDAEYGPNDDITLALDEAKNTVYIHPIAVYNGIKRQQIRHSSRIITQFQINNPQTSKLHNVIDMGLEFSKMIRLFKQGSKAELQIKVLSTVNALFNVESEEQFNEIHIDFCNWGTQNITLAEKKKGELVIKAARPASYGQIAKTLNVVLKVVIYYCNLPNTQKASLISGWLHAALDNKMMGYLKKHYSKEINPWPSTIEQVNYVNYIAIQKTVKKFIHDKHSDSITPVQFDDIYWEALNK